MNDPQVALQMMQTAKTSLESRARTLSIIANVLLVIGTLSGIAAFVLPISGWASWLGNLDSGQVCSQVPGQTETCSPMSGNYIIESINTIITCVSVGITCGIAAAVIRVFGRRARNQAYQYQLQILSMQAQSRNQN